MSISTRSVVESGNHSEIAGFVNLGTAARKTVLDPGQWPALASHGVLGVLPDPMLKPFRQQRHRHQTKYRLGIGPLEFTQGCPPKVGPFSWARLGRTPPWLVTLQPGLYTAASHGFARRRRLRALR